MCGFDGFDCLDNRKYRRQLELQYSHCRYIAEWFNTWSNLPFLLIGFSRLWLEDGNTRLPAELVLLYQLYIGAGIASGIHHAVMFPFSILVDWVPISCSIILLLYYAFAYNNPIWLCLTLSTWVKLLIALTMLWNDHVYTTIPVPFGHCFWHILAAFSIDASYQDFLAYGKF